jgi:hypothetical protein
VERMLAGLRYGRDPTDDIKLHNLLIPYAQLPREQRDKSRQDYVALVQRIGFRVVRVEQAKSSTKRRRSLPSRNSLSRALPQPLT